MHSNVHCSTVYNGQDTQETYMFIDMLLLLLLLLLSRFSRVQLCTTP